MRFTSQRRTADGVIPVHSVECKYGPGCKCPDDQRAQQWSSGDPRKRDGAASICLEFRDIRVSLPRQEEPERERSRPSMFT